MGYSVAFGTYHVIAKADADSTVPEVNNDNTIKPKAITIVPP
jgi:hypothetical protein